MHIIWFSWKDKGHPQAGGAETVSTEILARFVRDGHSVKLITSRYPGSGETAEHNGVMTYYVGSRYTVYFKAWRYYRKNLKGWEDVVVDEMNTIPFLAATYTTADKRILLAYQLARNVWFYQMMFPFSFIGYLMEPLLLRLAGSLYPNSVTESASSKHDMERHGFKDTQIFRVGMELKPLKSLETKNDRNLVLSLGAVRPMKRTLDAVKAFEHARDLNPDLHMTIAGDIASAYGTKVRQYIEKSPHRDAIEILGRVSSQEKLSLMRRAGTILVTSVKEGWGLIVTEANSQGTPAVVYDVDGLRDSVQDGITGIVSPDGDPKTMGAAIVDLLGDPHTYEKKRVAAWEWSKEFTFDKSYEDFLSAVKLDA